MECDYIALAMRSSPHSFRNLFLPICSTPIYPVQLLKKPSSRSRSLIYSFRLKYASFSAVGAVETNPISNSPYKYGKNSPSKLHEDFRKNPRKDLRASRHNLLPSDDKIELNMTSGVLNLDSKERLRRYSTMLRDCASKVSLKEARTLHGNVLKCGIEPDSHLWVSLINAYAKCGSVNDARQVFDAMPERDVVSWTAVTAGIVGQGYGNDGVCLYCEMRREGIRPNEFALATCLKACSMCLGIEVGKQVHTEAIKVGHFMDLFVGSALVDLYAKCGEIDLANRVFLCMPEQNAVSWNALLNGYAQIGDGKELIKLFCRMTKSEMKFSMFTLSTVLKGCANSGFLGEGQVVHSMAIKIGGELDEFLSCSLVDLYSKCGLPDDALKVFMRIKDPDVVAWSAMITCLGQQENSEEAVRLFHQMRCAGVRPNQFSLASIVSAATDLGDLHFGGSIHACICKCGFEFDSSVSNALVSMYMKNGCVRDGIKVFEAMKSWDSVSWNALLSGFHNSDTCNQGPKIFYQMLVDGFKPNVYTFISVLRACSSLLDVGFGKQVHAYIVKNSLDGNDDVGTALIDMYAKNRCLEDADLAFNRLIKRDLFTWTVIISGYAQSDQAEKAIKYFCQMQREGVKPNEFTLAGCLSGCSRTVTLENGRQLHSMAIKAGHLDDVFVASALVDLYGKCGCLEDAEAVFEGLRSRDTISWNTMICGYSKHGFGEKALEAYKLMLDEGNVPDEVTFVGVLSACSNMGLFEEGKEHFNSLSKVYGITPTIEHCACMVDILGKAGKFCKVESFIEEMKINQYSLIWETVLGACRLHGNVEFGETAAQKLFELEPRVDSNYVLLSNIFAAKGRWDDVRKIRALMSSQGVKKEPGCSWVEVEGQVHVFVSQDTSHPKIREIYIKLEELGEKLTSVGYKPKLEQVLHNVTETEKLEHLHHHSERLALAFALIGTSALKTIRIFKNLRICGDCHDVMKLISEITNRDIVVRDINHFHHFKSGTCSCRDYW
ncbi:PPR domain-containing protein/PPR_2 domain-containing protein/PPR_3 domain-containing protein/DYW_deaminase domain-containing protein [Cephalotus follicularis]|uniref:PPR domain-containing protein/PPR_2 domain-containing protein/PPR_3 domain-containing protein/DYW_deaminase domain-containing protein n=1 Tax=Cephalotus follicularis TaxID=3775 RepID=A0A1Q3BJV3_CEPFO|nr:PPR domain-containing protein/PPR_2 domain-containing protein/PPR_3 domain-containing protein/DYW_deaminase domain-containing protein [Cephalotus follicularis]